jgi:hypothetical protein
MLRTIPTNDGYAYRALRVVEQFGPAGCSVAQFSAAFFRRKPPSAKAKRRSPLYQNPIGSQVLGWLAGRGFLLALDSRALTRDRVYVLAPAGRTFIAGMLEAAAERANELAAAHGMPPPSAEEPPQEPTTDGVGSWEP